MKKIFWMTLCLAVLTSAWAYPQNGETTPKQGYGYALFTPGVAVGDGALATLTIGAGAEGLIKGGFGASADLSYLFSPEYGFSEGFGLFSPGVFYQFKPARRTVPFVTGGYSLAFRGGASNLIHFGGGINHWFNNHWGMRFEVRNHMQPPSAEYHLLQFRVAFLFR
ncbi:MAG TPA: hypothetical protein VFS12_01555 [Terriglobia bacterium]|nr:hypothetical protein [Terriglobia bacterium]